MRKQLSMRRIAMLVLALSFCLPASPLLLFAAGADQSSDLPAASPSVASPTLEAQGPDNTISLPGLRGRVTIRRD
jgi:hypothetical protein